MIVDYILGALLAEGAALLAYRAATGRGPKVIIANFAAGAALLVAWRLSASGAPIYFVLAALAASLLANVLDVAARWREPPAETLISKATIRMRAARRQGPDGVNRRSGT